MNEFPSNSTRFKQEQKANANVEKKINKVVSGTAKVRKKSEVSKIADIFVAEDMDNVKSYVWMDVIVPAVKKVVVDIITDGVNMIFYGTAGARDNRSRGSKVSYSRFYDDRDRDRDRRSSDSRSRTRFDFEDITFRSRGEAEAVREEMMNVIDTYGVVTVADMYDMADLSQPFTSNKYGWTSIRSAEVVRLRSGDYMLKLPRPMPID